jgi:hypothetical protein
VRLGLLSTADEDFCETETSVGLGQVSIQRDRPLEGCDAQQRAVGVHLDQAASIKWAGACLGARVRTFVKVFSADASRAARSST